MRRSIFDAAGGRCSKCDVRIGVDFHADHVIPYSMGGATALINAQALCARCNLVKGDRMNFGKYYQIASRTWQKEALAKCWRTFTAGRQRFLMAAAPGAGKTRAAAAIARLMLDAGRVEQVVVVAPRTKVAEQWIDALNKADVPSAQWSVVRSLRESGPVLNPVMTFQGLSQDPSRVQYFCSQRPTLVIIDELHHAASGASWGDSALHAFDNSMHILKLTGTPFRTDGNQIVWLDYDDDDVDASIALIDEDDSYVLSYGSAVELGYCRAIAFDYWTPKGGIVVRDEDGGTEHFKTLGDLTNRTRGMALSALFNWDGRGGNTDALESYLQSAHSALLDAKEYAPDAGGLVVAANVRHARLMANLLTKITGQEATIVNHTMPNASQVIDDFAEGKTGTDWIIAVSMIAEGTDIPRLRVLAFASRIKSELYFRQVMGRVVRKQTVSGHGDHARCLVPAAEPWCSYAKEVEDEIGYVVRRRPTDNPLADGVTPQGDLTVTDSVETTVIDPVQITTDGLPTEVQPVVVPPDNLPPIIPPIDRGDLHDDGDDQRIPPPPRPRVYVDPLDGWARNGGALRGVELTESQLEIGARIRDQRISAATTSVAALLAASISPHGWFLLDSSQ
jgi:superfamily II DNA or RNA helicase